jgi:predicted Zn-ribbon and HTH transcriptional regulator
LRKFKHNRKYNVGNGELGKAGEFRVASELLLRGHSIFMPTVDNGMDLVIDDGVTIQIKCGHKQPYGESGHTLNCYRFNFHKSYSKSQKEIHIVPHELNVDFVICWAIDDDEFYVIPADKIRGKTYLSFTADEEKRTHVKWNAWHPYLNAWGILDGEKIEDIKPTEELECKNCGHKWMPLTPNPTRCPSCNRRWYQKMYSYICKRCGASWTSKSERPSLCFKCNSSLWDKEKEINNRAIITCVRCNHSWQPESDVPDRCPKCKRRRYYGGLYKKCKQCDHEWFSTVNITYTCPKCHSSKWNREKEINNRPNVICKICGHSWQPKTDNPNSCPKCHRMLKSENDIYHKCNQCGHEWYSKVLHPVQCWKCHSCKWDREKQVDPTQVKEPILVV